MKRKSLREEYRDRIAAGTMEEVVGVDFAHCRVDVRGKVFYGCTFHMVDFGEMYDSMFIDCTLDYCSGSAWNDPLAPRFGRIGYYDPEVGVIPHKAEPKPS